MGSSTGGSPEFFLDQARRAGIPDEWVSNFLQFNPGDYHRILEAYASEGSANVERIASVALPTQFVNPVVNSHTGAVISSVANSAGSGSSRGGADRLGSFIGPTGEGPRNTGIVPPHLRGSSEIADAGVEPYFGQTAPSSRAVSQRTRLLASARKRSSRPAATNPAAVTGGLTASSPASVSRASILARWHAQTGR